MSYLHLSQPQMKFLIIIQNPRFVGRVTYYNCLHEKEPKCAVKEAIGTKISKRRYESYLVILRLKIQGDQLEFYHKP
jgi:hypothetical protein